MHRLAVKLILTLSFSGLVTFIIGLERKSDSHLATVRDDELPRGWGWSRLPGVALNPGGTACGKLGQPKMIDGCLCSQVPGINGAEGCPAVLTGWNSATIDPIRRRLVFWGGGHAAYYGNEVYAVDLRARKLVLLHDSDAPTPCVGGGDNGYGHPNSRHTYNAMDTVTHLDEFVQIGGAPACGSTIRIQPADIWTYSFATNDWTLKSTSSPIARGGSLGEGITVLYDPVSKLVYVSDTAIFFSWNPDTNIVTKLAPIPGGQLDYRMTPVLDPDRRAIYYFGCGGCAGGDLKGLYRISISKVSGYTVSGWNEATKDGCSAVTSPAYPGVSYDTRIKKVVGWVGGDEVAVFDPDTRRCQTFRYPGGPPAVPGEGGVEGHFRYLSPLDVFVEVNRWNEDAYILRLGPEVTSKVP